MVKHHSKLYLVKPYRSMGGEQIINQMYIKSKNIICKAINYYTWKTMHAFYHHNLGIFLYFNIKVSFSNTSVCSNNCHDHQAALFLI